MFLRQLQILWKILYCFKNLGDDTVLAHRQYLLKVKERKMIMMFIKSSKLHHHA